jgi:hypothetical protein
MVGLGRQPKSCASCRGSNREGDTRWNIQTNGRYAFGRNDLTLTNVNLVGVAAGRSDTLA